MQIKHTNRASENDVKTHEEKRSKAGKTAHGRSGDDDTSGGSRQGNAGQETDRNGSFGNR